MTIPVLCNHIIPKILVIHRRHRTYSMNFDILSSYLIIQQAQINHHFIRGG